MPLKRRAILIGNPFHKDLHYLRGVEVDLIRYKDYLKSESGGLWDESEITILLQKSQSEILQSINSIKADYSFTFFAGHGGYVDVDKIRVLTSTKIIHEEELYTKADKQLLILDCCRRKLPRNLYIKKIPRVMKAPIQLDYRKIFDKAIYDCSKGLITLYSAAVNEAAGENYLKGSFFSYNLIKSADYWARAEIQGSILNIFDAFTLAKSKTIQEYKFQHPQFNGGRRIDYFPFAIARS